MNNAVPRCFNSRRQYDLWMESARIVKPAGSSYCTDCSLEYQRLMIAQGRCAHPATMFCIDSDGFIEGRRPMEDRVQQREVT